jgi:hypothetical protein
LIIFGCAASPEITKIKGAWKYGQYSGGYIDHVLIVGRPRIEAVRAPFEDHLVKVFIKNKIDAIPSYNVIPEMKNLTRENIKQAADAAGVKTVLATQVVGVDEKEVLIRQSQQMEYIYTPNGMYMRPYLDGPKVVNFKKVRIESGLFELESEKLIWAAESAIMNPESADEAIKDFSKAIIQQLIQDGYVRP